MSFHERAKLDLVGGTDAEPLENSGLVEWEVGDYLILASVGAMDKSQERFLREQAARFGGTPRDILDAALTTYGVLLPFLEQGGAFKHIKDGIVRDISLDGSESPPAA